MNKVERIRRGFIKEERMRMLGELDRLAWELKQEPDSLKAEAILQDMREVGKSLECLVGKRVPDHEFLQEQEFYKEQARNAKRLRA